MKKKNNVIIGDPKDINFLTSTLQEIQPDVIICSNLIYKPQMECVRKYCRYFVYINHSIWSNDIIYNKQNEKQDLVQQYNIFDAMYVLPKEYDRWINLGISPEKIIKTPGLTCLDKNCVQNVIANKKKMFSQYAPNIKNIENVKTILVIYNSSSCSCKFPDESPKTSLENSVDYFHFLTEIDQYAIEEEEKNNRIHIFSKIGNSRDTLCETTYIKKLHHSKHISVIWPEDEHLMTEFLFADAIFVQGFITAYLEAVLSGNHNNVAQFYLNSKIMFDQNKYPNLPIITEQSQIKPLITKMLELNNHKTKLIKNEVEKIIEETFGQSSIINTSKLIMDDMLEIFKGV